ncbi:MAG TPA: DUF2520 domain-containing protein [Puia sp.]|nr:DUF2520 domain-containing protein [Puia sp.]
MNIVLIGSGNVATVLGRKSQAAGHRIIQVYNRDADHANVLATRLGTTSTSYISSIDRKADLMIIALRDDAVGYVAREIGEVRSILVHTAGALSIDEVKGSNKSYGVLYPLQSLRKEIEILPALSILVEGNNTGTLRQLKEFAFSIAETVKEADDETRLKYHLAATMVNNFTNHLYSLAASFCEKENISFSVLQPLIEETAIRLRKTTPQKAQTGPAVRNDTSTIEKHGDLLKKYPDILNMYNLFTSEIQKSALSLEL